MLVPSSNLLSQAATLIGLQKIGWRKFGGVRETADGLLLPHFYPKGTIDGSFQPVSAGTKNNLGLDISKEYANIYTRNLIQQPADKNTGDLLFYGDKTWQVIQSVDWFGQDGWRAVSLVSSEISIDEAPVCLLPDEVEVVLE